MRSLVTVLLLALTSETLGSPFPDPEADPGYKVIKTVHFWDDDKDGEDLLKETLDLGDAKMDNNEIFELDESADRPEGRTLIGYGNGDGLHRSKHGQEAQHDNDRFQGEDNHIFPFKLNEDPNTKALVSDQLVNNSDVTVTKEGLKCIKKLMQVEYTDFTEVMTCVHKSEERCHTSYVTQFVGHQEQKCDEKFEKTCTIYYENVAVNEEVEVCKTYLCPDCTREGPEECDTVYDTVCETKRKIHNVLDDVVNCKTVEEKKCEQVTDGELMLPIYYEYKCDLPGFRTKEQCDTWPVERCEVEQVSVNKTTPETSCREEPRRLCAPRGCAEKQARDTSQFKILLN